MFMKQSVSCDYIISTGGLIGAWGRIHAVLTSVYSHYSVHDYDRTLHESLLLNLQVYSMLMLKSIYVYSYLKFGWHCSISSTSSNPPAFVIYEDPNNDETWNNPVECPLSPGDYSIIDDHLHTYPPRTLHLFESLSQSLLPKYV